MGERLADLNEEKTEKFEYIIPPNIEKNESAKKIFIQSMNPVQIEYNHLVEILFKYVGPSCVNGPCPEGSMSCGKTMDIRKEYAIK